MSHYARRTDLNHTDIVDALRLRGHRVQSLASCGGGVPDLLVGTAPRFGRRLLLLEVKGKRNKRGDSKRLTEAQAEWHAEWRGYRIHTATSIEEAIDACEGE